MSIFTIKINKGEVIMKTIGLKELLNQYVADTAVFIIKLHNIHWNILGDEFMKMHKYTEELYNRFFETYDEFAELLKMAGETVYGSMRDYLRVATIKELETNDMAVKEGMEYILEDLSMLRLTVSQIREIAHRDSEYSVSLVAEDEIRYLDKEIWLLKAMLGKK
jgi:starvation-inducible DNA-binding protein